MTPCSSPITPEQISVAKFADENLINWPSDEQTPGARFAKDAQVSLIGTVLKLLTNEGKIHLLSRLN